MYRESYCTTFGNGVCIDDSNGISKSVKSSMLKFFLCDGGQGAVRQAVLYTDMSLSYIIYLTWFWLQY